MRDRQTSILIVDNDAPTRDMLAVRLDGNYDCSSVANAEMAIGLLTFRGFDLVITELELPGVSGLALCQFVQKTRPDTAVILMSERITPWTRIVAAWLGVFDCARKQCDLASLPNLIERASFWKAQRNRLEVSESTGDVHQMV